MDLLAIIVSDNECLDAQQTHHPNVLAHDLALWTRCEFFPRVRPTEEVDELSAGGLVVLSKVPGVWQRSLLDVGEAIVEPYIKRNRTDRHFREHYEVH